MDPCLEGATMEVLQVKCIYKCPVAKHTKSARK